MWFVHPWFNFPLFCVKVREFEQRTGGRQRMFCTNLITKCICIAHRAAWPCALRRVVLATDTTVGSRVPVALTTCTYVSSWAVQGRRSIQEILPSVWEILSFKSRTGWTARAASSKQQCNSGSCADRMQGVLGTNIEVTQQPGGQQ